MKNAGVHSSINEAIGISSKAVGCRILEAIGIR